MTALLKEMNKYIKNKNEVIVKLKDNDLDEESKLYLKTILETVNKSFNI